MMEAPKQNLKDGLDKEVRLDEKSAIGEHGASRFGFDGALMDFTRCRDSAAP